MALFVLVAAVAVTSACGGGSDDSTAGAPIEPTTARESSPTQPPAVSQPTSLPPTVQATVVLQHFANPDRRWNRSPAILVIAPANDPRIKMVSDAVAHWNTQLAQIGTPFRLGNVTVETGAIAAGTMAILSGATVAGEPTPTPGAAMEAYRRVVTGRTGDLIIVLSNEVFVSFASPFLPAHYVVGIRDINAAPLNLPNVARNVILHEIGHAIGLGHNNDPTKLMCGRPAECRPESFSSATERCFPITEEEKAHLLRLYPR